MDTSNTANSEGYTTKDTKDPTTPRLIPGVDQPPETVCKLEVQTERNKEDLDAGGMETQTESQKGTCTHHTPTYPLTHSCILIHTHMRVMHCHVSTPRIM